MTLELYYNTKLGVAIDRNKDPRCIAICIAMWVFHIANYCNTLFGVSLQPYYLLQFPKVFICDKHFPGNWLSACHDDNKKAYILNVERLSIMAALRRCSLDVSKLCDLMQNLRQSSVLLTFLYVKHIKIVN